MSDNKSNFGKKPSDKSGDKSLGNRRLGESSGQEPAFGRSNLKLGGNSVRGANATGETRTTTSVRRPGDSARPGSNVPNGQGNGKARTGDPLRDARNPGSTRPESNSTSIPSNSRNMASFGNSPKSSNSTRRETVAPANARKSGGARTPGQQEPRTTSPRDEAYANSIGVTGIKGAGIQNSRNSSRFAGNTFLGQGAKAGGPGGSANSQAFEDDGEFGIYSDMRSAREAISGSSLENGGDSPSQGGGDLRGGADDSTGVEARAAMREASKGGAQGIIASTEARATTGIPGKSKSQDSGIGIFSNKDVRRGKHMGDSSKPNSSPRGDSTRTGTGDDDSDGIKIYENSRSAVYRTMDEIQEKGGEGQGGDSTHAGEIPPLSFGGKQEGETSRPRKAQSGVSSGNRRNDDGGRGGLVGGIPGGSRQSSVPNGNGGASRSRSGIDWKLLHENSKRRIGVEEVDDGDDVFGSEFGGQAKSSEKDGNAKAEFSESASAKKRQSASHGGAPRGGAKKAHRADGKPTLWERVKAFFASLQCDEEPDSNGDGSFKGEASGGSARASKGESLFMRGGSSRRRGAHGVANRGAEGADASESSEGGFFARIFASLGLAGLWARIFGSSKEGESSSSSSRRFEMPKMRAPFSGTISAFKKDVEAMGFWRAFWKNLKRWSSPYEVNDSNENQLLPEHNLRLYIIMWIILFFYAVMSGYVIYKGFTRPTDEEILASEVDNGITLRYEVNPSLRGKIYDRNGNVLAISKPVDDIYIDKYHLMDFDYNVLKKARNVPKPPLSGTMDVNEFQIYKLYQMRRSYLLRIGILAKILECRDDVQNLNTEGCSKHLLVRNLDGSSNRRLMASRNVPKKVYLGEVSMSDEVKVHDLDISGIDIRPGNSRFFSKRQIYVNPTQLVDFTKMREEVVNDVTKSVEEKKMLLDEIDERRSMLARKAHVLAELVGVPVDIVLGFLTRENYLKFPGDQYIKKHLFVLAADKIRDLNIPGVENKRTSVRVYPFDYIFTQIVGTSKEIMESATTTVKRDKEEAEVENRCRRKEPRITGVSQVEKSFEGILKGEDGCQLVRNDQNGNILEEIASASNKKVKHGQDVYLSLDANLQEIMMSALRHHWDENKADFASAVILDAKTGEILAIGSYPSFSRTLPELQEVEYLVNKASETQTDPASTMKPLVIAKAMNYDSLKDENGRSIRITKDTKINVNPVINVNNRNYVDRGRSGVAPVSTIILKSLNTGSIRIGLMIPSKDYYQYLHDLGFGSKPNSGLLSETPGQLPTKKMWFGGRSASVGARASVSIGYNISVSILQLARAYTALADGYVKDVTIRRLDGEPKRKQVLKPEVARVVRGLMKDVVQVGTGSHARIEGYDIAGKTGTARRYNAKRGGYDEDKHNSFFVAMAPSSDPQFIVTVEVNNPKVNNYYGGHVAAPLARDILSGLLEYYFVPKIGQKPPRTNVVSGTP